MSRWLRVWVEVSDERTYLHQSFFEGPETICGALERRGLACWISLRDIRAENYQEAIFEQLKVPEL